MNTVKFISTQYLKDNTAIENNVDDTLLGNYILKSQDTHIQQTLGSGYYDYLKNQVVSSSLTTQENILMRQYIQPTLAEFTFYEVIPHLNYKATNKAVSQQSSEFTQPSTIGDIKYLRNTVLDLAEFYLRRLTKELCSGKYPLIGSFSDQNLNRNNKAYFSGIYLTRKNYE